MNELEPQPLLFDEDALPVMPAVVVAATRWEHNGRYTLADDELCDQIAQRCVMGFSCRSIARTLHVSRLTIRAVMSVLEERGKLGPLKQRMSRKMGHAVDLCLDRSIEALEENRVPVNVLPIMAGVLFDKKSLIDGDPTSRVAVQEESVSVESVRAWVDELRRRRRGAVEVQSTASAAETQQIDGKTVDVTVDVSVSDGKSGILHESTGGGDRSPVGPAKSTMDSAGENL